MISFNLGSQPSRANLLRRHFSKTLIAMKAAVDAPGEAPCHPSFGCTRVSQNDTADGKLAAQRVATRAGLEVDGALLEMRFAFQTTP